MKENEDRIYKDLTYTQKAYFSGEQIFPTWESIYAIIVSGFLITYFAATSLGFPQKLILSVIGLVLSLSWFCLVSRNLLYSEARHDRMKKLEKAIQSVNPDEAEKTQNGVNLFNLIQYQEDFINDKKHKKPWNKIGTWYIRKFIPFLLSIIWLVLMIYTFVS